MEEFKQNMVQSKKRKIQDIPLQFVLYTNEGLKLYLNKQIVLMSNIPTDDGANININNKQQDFKIIDQEVEWQNGKTKLKEAIYSYEKGKYIITYTGKIIWLGNPNYKTLKDMDLQQYYTILKELQSNELLKVYITVKS